MADFLPAEREGLFEYNLTPVIHSLEDVAEWNRYVFRARRQRAYHLKIDSGMGRLGTLASASRILDAVTSAHQRAPRRSHDPLRFLGRLRQLAN